jgi:hypothetical protein
MVLRSSKSDNVKKVRSFLNDAFNDYLAARVLLLAGLPQQGAVLSSTAIEKYFKAVLAFRGNVCHGHLKSAHWNGVKNFSPEVFSRLDLDFLELNQKCFRLRYTDDIPIGFNLVIPSREFLSELDHTALMLQRGFVIKGNGTLQKTEFDSLLARHDDRLWAENHILLGIQKTQFIYQSPQFVYEVRNDPARGLLEATYTAEGLPKVSSFLRPGFVPIDGNAMSYEFAYGQSSQSNSEPLKSPRISCERPSEVGHFDC